MCLAMCHSEFLTSAVIFLPTWCAKLISYTFTPLQGMEKSIILAFGHFHPSNHLYACCSNCQEEGDLNIEFYSTQSCCYPHRILTGHVDVSPRLFMCMSCIYTAAISLVLFQLYLSWSVPNESGVNRRGSLAQ